MSLAGDHAVSARAWHGDPVVRVGSRPAARVTVDGDELLLMCSNDYLGLAGDPRLADAAADAARRWGTGAGASSRVSGATELHAALEARLARLKASEDAVLFSSGYLANLGTITALTGAADVVVSDELNHASIVDGCRLSGAAVAVFPHGDAAACARHVAAARRRGAGVLIVTDSVFSMDGDLAPLADLVAIAAENDATLMVDEAHATGVLGGGRGALAAAGLEGRAEVVMGTCSKALGAAGGFVAGSADLCRFLRLRARPYVFDTAQPAPVSAAVLAALDVVAGEPWRGERACANARRLAAGLARAGWATTEPAAAIVPVVMGDAASAVDVSARARRRGVLAPPILPPAVPDGTARIRLCPTASHSDSDVDVTIAAFGRAPGQAS
ncbi:MAG: 8-amino-7-oxononanoate synthase [Acidimicrobiia bacterium]